MPLYFIMFLFFITDTDHIMSTLIIGLIGYVSLTGFWLFKVKSGFALLKHLFYLKLDLKFCFPIIRWFSMCMEFVTTYIY